jgi:hypothetical protein
MQRDPLGNVEGLGFYHYANGNPINNSDPTGQVSTSGRKIDCGGGCTIRIEGNHHNGERHLHWECAGRGSGVMGENGKKSHGGSYGDAPAIILDCAKENGFNPGPPDVGVAKVAECERICQSLLQLELAAKMVGAGIGRLLRPGCN